MILPEIVSLLHQFLAFDFQNTYLKMSPSHCTNRANCLFALSWMTPVIAPLPTLAGMLTKRSSHLTAPRLCCRSRGRPQAVDDVRLQEAVPDPGGRDRRLRRRLHRRHLLREAERALSEAALLRLVPPAGGACDATVMVGRRRGTAESAACRGRPQNAIRVGLSTAGRCCDEAAAGAGGARRSGLARAVGAGTRRSVSLLSCPGGVP